MLDSLLHHRWIARTIGDEKTVIVLFAREIVVPWANFNFNTPSQETPQLIILHANVEVEDTKSTSGGMLQGRFGGWLVKLSIFDGDWD